LRHAVNRLNALITKHQHFGLITKSCTVTDFYTNHRIFRYNADASNDNHTAHLAKKDYLHASQHRPVVIGTRCSSRLAGVFVEAKFLPNVVVDDFVVRRHIFNELKEFFPQLIRFHLIIQ